MKIAILSRAPRCFSTRRLKEAAEARGHATRVLDPLQFSLLVEEQRPRLFHRNKAINGIDAIIPRIGASVTFFGTAVVRQFEQMGVFTLNSSAAIGVSRDKLRTMQILSRHDIGMPPTAFVRSKADVLPAIERVGGAPVIIKVLEGTQGVGVILAEKISIANAIIETLQSARQNVLIQKFVAESNGRDIRAFVVGDRVVASMRRTASPREFRSNIHRGGSSEPVTLDPIYTRTAVRAAQILGLRVAGIDMLETNAGPQILEVNSSPGLQGIEQATGVDVAGEVIQHLEERVVFPEIDLRQRLMLSKGYGVAELTVAAASEFANRTLAECALDEREIRVLSITRQGLVIPNPNGSNRLLAGDVLLCYGKLLALQALLPPPPAPARGKRRPRPRRTQAAG